MTSVLYPGGKELSRPGRTVVWIMVVAVLFGLGFLEAVPQSKAMLNGRPASIDNAQVRIYENGEFAGGGTVVAPNWVLTVAHSFERIDSNTYSLTFGVVDSSQNPGDQSNLRSIDRIVLHSTLADVALAHFADPVPSTIRIPDLAQAAPERFSAAVQYGWGPDGLVLNRALTLIIDPVASANAADKRDSDPTFATNFPAGVDPMAANALGQFGDSGSGVFDGNNVLLAVVSCLGAYRYANVSGNLYGPRRVVTYQEPVWYFRDWITRIISGEGTSNPDPPHDELKRRRLTEDPTGKQPPMTGPPEMDPIPTWAVAALTAETGTDGLVSVLCPAVDGHDNACTMGAEGQAEETIGHDDPVKIRVGSGRQVVAWCRATASLTEGAEPVNVTRVSFTNTETAEESDPPPTGYGWFDVDPAQVLTDQTAIDPTSFATC